MDPLARLVAQGFTHISFDLSKGAYVTAWNKGQRRTHTATARTAEEAVEILLVKAGQPAPEKPKDSVKAVSSMFEDLLG